MTSKIRVGECNVVINASFFISKSTFPKLQNILGNAFFLFDMQFSLIRTYLLVLIPKLNRNQITEIYTRNLFYKRWLTWLTWLTWHLTSSQVCSVVWARKALEQCMTQSQHLLNTTLIINTRTPMSRMVTWVFCSLVYFQCLAHSRYSNTCSIH